jgi:hypothetical protein
MSEPNGNTDSQVRRRQANFIDFMLPNSTFDGWACYRELQDVTLSANPQGLAADVGFSERLAITKPGC